MFIVYSIVILENGEKNGKIHRKIPVLDLRKNVQDFSRMGRTHVGGTWNKIKNGRKPIFFIKYSDKFYLIRCKKNCAIFIAYIRTNMVIIRIRPFLSEFPAYHKKD